MRVIVSAVLRREGYHVLEASTPRGACDLFEQHAQKIDLLLTDVVMPEMNGPALAQRLISEKPELRVLFISGRREEDIPIVFTGARAGEKVHEVLWNEGEAVGPTSHPKIMRAARPQIDAAWLEEALGELERLVDDGDTLGVVSKLGSMVSEPVRTGRAPVLEDTLH